MTRTLMILVAVAFGFAATSALAGTVALPDTGSGSLTFDTNSFANGFQVHQTPVEDAISATGHDLETFARIGGPDEGSVASKLELSFRGNLVNGIGTDLWIYEIGILESMNLTIGIGSQTKTVTPTDTGGFFMATNSAGKLVRVDYNLVKIDLSDFGFSTGKTDYDSILITAPLKSGSQSVYLTPDIGAVAANLYIDNQERHAVVPLPSSALMGLGLLAVALAGRVLRRRRR